MKTYRNEELGFEMDIPQEWSIDPRHQSDSIAGRERSLIFHCRSCEAFNLQVRNLYVQPDLEQTEDEISRFAHQRGYTHLAFGRLIIAGREQVWSRYYTGYGNWSKKYVLSFNNTEYTFTSACLDEKLLLELERTWDETVGSFRLLIPESDPAPARGESPQESEEIANKQEFEHEMVAPQIVAPPKARGTKTYRNEKHGFEIDLPETWMPAPGLPASLENTLFGRIPPGLQKDCFQYGCYEEAINFEIGPLYPEPLLDDTVIEFRIYAQVQGFMDLHFGRINVAGKEHVCAHYFINDNLGRRWNKKYMLVFGGIEYALTMTCNDPGWFAKREKDWDTIIQSFHVLAPVDETINSTPKAERDRQIRRTMVQERIEMIQDPVKALAKAYQAMALGQYLDARVLLDEYLRSKPDDVEAHKQMAALLQKMGDKAGAIQHLKEVERLDPSDAANRANLARLMAESGTRV